MPVEPGQVPIAPAAPNRRALILPGGGMRVAYQAGVLKALHDSGLRFSFADGASGGTMNLAALLGGASPDQLCARWRTLDVTGFVSRRPLAAYARFPQTGALGDFDSIEARVFPHLGIDAARVRKAEGIQATFNVCDFDDKIVRAIPHREISHELLLAGISLPLATPPVRWQGKTWTDAVWIRDANLLAAVAAGANELWVAWLIGNTPAFKDGLLEQYVHMIEIAAIGTLNEELAEIARLNARIAAGERPWGHDAPIAVHMIRPDIPLPLDPDFLTGKIDGGTLVAYGYRDATAYLERRSAAGSPLDPTATKMREPNRGVQFRETMTGRIAFGETDPRTGFRSLAAMPVAIHATIDIDDIKAFVRDPDHMGLLSGHLELHRRGGWLPATRGVIGLFTPARDDPKLSYMIYAIGVVIGGKRYWFNGRKHVRMGGPWKMWKATTTLYVTLHEGEDETGPIVAAGILSLGVPALISLAKTFHSAGCVGIGQRLGAVFSFFRFFTGQLVRHYITRRRV
ncbi:MAG TPA: patatin-like phospholipase family protein [Allosphingosinicella sp.]|nr:patatin-like phospholipase family protein [Allosphingosinicella sp.]